jgi:hypothetical protein
MSCLTFFKGKNPGYPNIISSMNPAAKSGCKSNQVFEVSKYKTQIS